MKQGRKARGTYIKKSASCTVVNKTLHGTIQGFLYGGRFMKKLKKLTVLLLAVVMVVTMLPVQSQAASKVQLSDGELQSGATAN